MELLLEEDWGEVDIITLGKFGNVIEKNLHSMVKRDNILRWRAVHYLLMELPSVAVGSLAQVLKKKKWNVEWSALRTFLEIETDHSGLKQLWYGDRMAQKLLGNTGVVGGKVIRIVESLNTMEALLAVVERYNPSAVLIVGDPILAERIASLDTFRRWPILSVKKAGEVVDYLRGKRKKIMGGSEEKGPIKYK